MLELVPVDHDPFSESPASPALAPAPNDPSAAGAGSAALQLVPVDHDPFSEPTDPIPVGPDPSKQSTAVSNSLASKPAEIYPFPAKPQRPFSADYPQEPATDASGRLKFDIEGRPLVAPRIVGRRTLGGGDEALSPAEFDAVGTAGTGRRPKSFSANQAGGAASAGRLQVRSDSQGRQTLQIHLNSDLAPEQRSMVLGHELGHVIDHLTGVPSPKDVWNSIPQTDAMRRELERVYSAGATGEHRTSNPAAPAAGAAGYQLVPVDHDPFAQ